jgi:hypothetical protein
MKRTNLTRLLSALCVAAAVQLTTAVEAATNLVSGYLYGTNNWVASDTYILTGFTYVMSNSVLNIEAGTVIQGVAGSGSTSEAANDFGCLFVCQGGRLNALGTANSPIIFTSDADDVTDPGDLPFPTRGLWGGIVLFGNARINNPAWTTNNVSYDIYEGLPDLSVTNTTPGSPFNGQVDYLHRFGGSNDDDSSGVMRYVSVRHGGKKLTTNKEINGWSLGGVGRGTTLEYLEAYCIADDGFEFFGGSVNTKHLVSAFNDDDLFDTDEGYNGKNQFWFGIQEPSAKDNGSEQNGQPEPNDIYVTNAVPVANYVVRNATLIGAGTDSGANNALRFRRGNQASWINSVFTQFGGIRVLISDDGVSTPTVVNNVWFGFGQTAGDDYGSIYVPAESNPVADPLLRGVSRTADRGLDPTVLPASPVFTAAGATPADGFWSQVNYAGAFNQENWMQDWSALDAEGFLRATAIAVRGPTGSAPVVPNATITRTETGFRLEFPTEAGRTYIIQVRSSLNSGTWSEAGPSVPGTGSTASVGALFGSDASFYRVVVE